ncbi:MAG: hypothetical protein GY953_58725 [bacterium]|nr:hypothetical protein [bacterium]
MRSTQSLFERAAVYLTFGASVATLFSIAVCHTLMALALAALLLSGTRLRLPPIKLPLALFLLGTVISLALSADPWAGRPQIRKFFIFVILLLIASALRNREHIRRLMLAWFAVASVSAALGLFQFFETWRRAAALGYDFYEFYIGERITGLMSHWQTFGGHMMLAFVLVGAFILFAPASRRRMVIWAGCAAVVAVAIVLGYNRNIWLGAFTGGIYLLWFWRRWVIAVIPVALVLVVLVGPASIRTRIVSVFQPQGDLDSNQHRIVCWRTGLAMIKAHPFFGVGPQHVEIELDEYLPDDISRPLPEGWYGHLHSNYIHYAAERGIPTALALLWMLLKALFDFLRALGRGQPPDAAYVLHGGVAAIIAILVAGFFELNLGDTEVVTFFLAILACGYNLLEDATEPAASPA